MHHNFTYKLADHIDVSSKKSTEIESTPSKISHLKPIKEENASDLKEPTKTKPAPDKSLEAKSSQAQNEPFEIQLLNENLKLDDNLYKIYFNLTSPNKSSTRAALLKCDVCDFSCFGAENKGKLDLNSISNHISKFHLSTGLIDPNEEESSDVEEIVKNLMNSLIQKIENGKDFSFKCAMCSTSSFQSKTELNTHVAKHHELNEIKCVECSQNFSLKNPADLIHHVKQDHPHVLAQLFTAKTKSNDKSFDLSEFFLTPLEETWTVENAKGDQDEDEEASSSASYNSNSQMKHSNEEEAASKSNEDNQSEPDEIESKPKTKVKPKLKKPFKPNCMEQPMLANPTNEAASSTKTWTCQLCKKQFDQRIDLSKHQCIELHLKLLKKKKELRKKKLREAHWKRKIDLSYIETTSLTQLPQNIADNLGFCIDGTIEDMKAYTREVKDYLSTELGHETEMQMFLKCCFPEYADSQSETVDNSVLRKANSYFIDCVYSGADASKSNKNGNSSYTCKSCRYKCRKVNELIQHQKEAHNLDLKTAFDFYNREMKDLNSEESEQSLNWCSGKLITNSPIGFLGCDPYAYLVNLHWDQSLHKKCADCGGVFLRQKLRKHALECKAKSVAVVEAARSSYSPVQDLNLNPVKEETVSQSHEQEIIIFEPRTGPCEKEIEAKTQDWVIILK